MGPVAASSLFHLAKSTDETVSYLQPDAAVAGFDVCLSGAAKLLVHGLSIRSAAVSSFALADLPQGSICSVPHRATQHGWSRSIVRRAAGAPPHNPSATGSSRSTPTKPQPPMQALARGGVITEQAAPRRRRSVNEPNDTQRVGFHEAATGGRAPVRSDRKRVQRAWVVGVFRYQVISKALDPGPPQVSVAIHDLWRGPGVNAVLST
jgi:hypothetical protein